MDRYQRPGDCQAETALRLRQGLLAAWLGGVIMAGGSLTGFGGTNSAVGVLPSQVFTNVQPALTMFEAGQLDRVQKDPGRQAVTLEQRVVVEDDSPGAGVGQEPDGTARKNYDEITKTCQAKKELVLKHLPAQAAVLSFYAAEPAGKDITGTIPLLVRVNGREVRCDSQMQKLPEPYRKNRPHWMYLEIPPEALKVGTNEIIFATASDQHPWQLLISENQYFPAGGADPELPLPNHSACSRDGGKTWDYDHLGVAGAMDGEYMVRLTLRQYAAQGTLTSPVFDLGASTAGSNGICPRLLTQQLRLQVEAATPPGTAVRLEYRAGNSLQLLPNHWSVWVPQEKVVGYPRGRFAQWRATLSTKDPNVTPVLKNVTQTVKALVQPAPDADIIFLRDAHNETIVRSSYPYEYEAFDHPRLAELRKRYQLDLVVQGAATEFEKIVQLKNWVARQYAREVLQAWYLVGNGRVPYPPWDAHLILTQKGYSCVSFAILFMQVCQAFGITCRHVQINALCDGGHEVNEVWSNDYGKWIFIDAGYNHYVCDRATGVPLSVQELEAVLARYQVQDQLVELLPGLPPVPACVVTEGDLPLRYVVEPSPMNEIRVTGPAPDMAGFQRVHAQGLFFMAIIPRNNFLSKPAPMPLNQGTSHWPWNGYVVWADERVPQRPQYSHYARKLGDLYWTLNQAAFRLEYGNQPGTLTVYLDTETPEFETFLARRDGADWEPVQPLFTWRLHSGINRLELCTRNRSGNLGRTSFVTLSYLKELDGPQYPY